MATEKQVEANRANAMKSTGPKSEEGKQRSRRNGLKHGLAAKEMLPAQDELAAEKRAEAWGVGIGPVGDEEAWLVRRMAVESIRLDRCFIEESQARVGMAERAEGAWEIDGRLEAEKLGKKLEADPALVTLQLMGSKPGCAWMVERWEAWIEAVGAKGPDAEQVGRALDLLGVRHGERQGKEGLATVERARCEAENGRGWTRRPPVATTGSATWPRPGWARTGPSAGCAGTRRRASAGSSPPTRSSRRCSRGEASARACGSLRVRSRSRRRPRRDRSRSLPRPG